MIAIMMTSTFYVAALLSINSGNTIQIFSIIAGAVIVVLAGLFTIRAKNAEWWQQSYEGVKTAYNEEKNRSERLTRDNAALIAENASLRALPNYDIVVTMLRQTLDENKAQSSAQLDAVKYLTSVIEARLPQST